MRVAKARVGKEVSIRFVWSQPFFSQEPTLHVLCLLSYPSAPTRAVPIPLPPCPPPSEVHLYCCPFCPFCPVHSSAHQVVKPLPTRDGPTVVVPKRIAEAVPLWPDEIPMAVLKSGRAVVP
jgi:hypothetical protein